MLQGEHSAILATFIKIPFDIKTFVLSILGGHLSQVLLQSISERLCEPVYLLSLIRDLTECPHTISVGEDETQMRGCFSVG